MLVFPEFGSNIVTLVGIDPGTTMLGYGVLAYDASTLDIVYTEATSFNSERMIISDCLISYTHTDRMARIDAQYRNLVRLFKYHRPFEIACESPFFNRQRPAAFGALVEILSAINMAAMDYDGLTSFIPYPPSVIKKSVGAGAFCDKDEIKARMLQIKDLNFRGPYPLENVDEHALDALATAVCHYKQLTGRNLVCSL